MTQPILILDDPSITVHCYVDEGVIHHEVHAFCNMETMKRALTAGVEAMREHGATKWLSDDRKNGPLSADQEAWGRQVWFPSAYEAGWRFWAICLPEGVVARQTLERRIAGYAQQGVTVERFDDPTVAWGWLRHQAAP
ncbi:MAG: hypothetical protein OXU20_39965 [Myxococcales bacterium]|nr:hypothetical protein [Myxococcales bacterium]MDD9968129.1 hypothetical protein [Myxococcales bacterium]